MKKTKHYIIDCAKRRNNFLIKQGFIYDWVQNLYRKNDFMISTQAVFKTTNGFWKLFKNDVKKNNLNQVYTKKNRKIVRVKDVH